MSVAVLDARAETMTWVGVGNVEGVLLRAQAAVSPRRESLLLRGGVIGGRLPALLAAILVFGVAFCFLNVGWRRGQSC